MNLKYNKNIYFNLGPVIFFIFSNLSLYYLISNTINSNQEFLNNQFTERQYIVIQNKISYNLTKYKNNISYYENEFKKLRSTFEYNWHNFSYYSCNFYVCKENIFSNGIFLNHIKQCQESFLNKINELQNDFIIFDFTKNILDSYFLSYNLVLNIDITSFDRLYNLFRNKYIIIITDDYIANGIISNSFKQIIYNHTNVQINLTNNKNIIGLPLLIEGFFEIYYIKGKFKGSIYNGQIFNGLAQGIGTLETIDGNFISTIWNKGKISKKKYLYVYNYKSGFRKYYIKLNNFDDNKVNVTKLLNLY